ncbi:response regulator transcription factor [Paenibacillus methanolicus]|uniref:Two-component system, NarL family, response regulator LiaR n=1 Tax=Paenibacillus methanolicus TaxID=582686 RepID=A0A5S5BZ86_9BACL|nr:response regulator transcription factor [Paenibacillus methanolicus]TYP72491.1 two-component system, NarL family, response regulator LiaR [Paenibacillus methanolicus]
MTPIRVLMVEDDPDWIKAVTAYLNRESDLLVVGSATAADEAVRLAKTLAFDVVLMDIQLSDKEYEGIYAAMEIHAIHPAKIVMLTSVRDERAMTQSFTAGAIDYLEKSRFHELPQAIRKAHHHAAPMEALLKEFSRLKREEQLKDLTSAEREVFELIEDGYTQPQIEKKLFKAESTLKNQINKMLKKLGVKSSKEAVELVRKNGLVPKRGMEEEAKRDH